MADVPPEFPADEEAVEGTAEPSTERTPPGREDNSTAEDGGVPTVEEPTDSPGDGRAGAGPRVVGVDSEAADDLLGALSAETAREALDALHEEPATASELADRLDVSLQTVHYHLGNLADAGVAEVVDTTTSEKGREMDVYGPAAGPVVLFAGDEETGSGLRDAVRRLIGGFGFLALVSLLVQEVFGDGVGALFGEGPAQPTTEVEQFAADAPAGATGVEPGVAFFAGGAVVLLVGFAVWYWRRHEG